ncbi:MAG TPA: SDR family oxidoreductase [Ktedonobacteraceae bacterium]|nr:SDR family oxidoreductase [Ktedonobacteraceae bacterium]
MQLDGKVALVIGGGRGIGAASARVLASQGASVAVNYLQNAASAEQVVAQIRAAGGKAISVQADVLDIGQVAHMVELTHGAYGRLDILVHSASVSAIFKPFAQLSWEEFMRGIDGVLRGVFNSTKAVLPLMQQQDYGRIVYIGSGVGKTPLVPGAISLSTGKAGLVAFAKYIAREYGPYGITANVVAPGMVETDLSAVMPAEHKQRAIAMTPPGRIAQPEDIARVVAFFASDASGFMTGAYAPVNGGMTMD